jgi:hypothetical protein
MRTADYVRMPRGLLSGAQDLILAHAGLQRRDDAVLEVRLAWNAQPRFLAVLRLFAKGRRTVNTAG